jgi:hypothetical protein
MLPSYLRSTGNIKAKVRSRSLLKSQIPRPKVSAQKKKNPDNQSTGWHLRSKFKGGFEVFDDLLREHVGIGKVVRFFEAFVSEPEDLTACP